ncbi:hypothetical protein LJC56_11465 [Christensenellaceae bacterium OttesenSCG-928-K19]|nr:hypothetical protein [Christensenellaceae bacterium OttesenSCG-928-K19]
MRSPGNNNNNAAVVNNNGSVNATGNNVNNDNGIRPDLPQQPETRIHAGAVRAGAKEPHSRPVRLCREDKHMPPEEWTRSLSLPSCGASAPRLAVDWRDGHYRF